MVTTPITWKVRKRGRTRLSVAEAAVVQLSVVGAAIVAPDRWEAPVGTRVEVFWEGYAAWVVVRREAPYQDTENFRIYGVEYCDARSELGPAIYDRLVVEAQAAPIGPALWLPPE
ncbi:hypothetical protein [Aquihabitans sp. McL0605]|uniref:hypothetical protein n=1 Tax=Aquihabitans sp. McL0605 TaxID=3415671 RepID=UPI003CE91D10